MKGRIVAAVLCVLLALTLSVASERYIIIQTGRLTEYLDSALSAEPGSAEMYGAALNAYEEWHKRAVLFGSLLKHSDVDELDHDYSLIVEYVKSEDIEELSETLEECKITLKVIADGEKPKIDNIF